MILAPSLSSKAEHAITKFNASTMWQRSHTVWGHQFIAPSADRLLYLFLHKLGLMGTKDKSFYEKIIFPGANVIDVGANIDLFSLLFSKLVGPNGKVFSFEPDQILFKTFDYACLQNKIKNIRRFNYALDQTQETKILHKSLFNSGDNYISESSPHSSAFSHARSNQIETISADQILKNEGNPTIDFIKIDVQGYEFNVLKGMSHLLDSNPKVKIYFEFWPTGLKKCNSSPKAIFSFLQSKGFTLLGKPYLFSKTERPVIFQNPKDIPDLKGNQFIDILAVRLPN